MNDKTLKLRPWKLSDAEDLFHYASDPQIGYNCGWPPHRSIEDSRSCVTNVLAQPETYAIILKETNRPIGCIALKPSNPICAEIDPRSAEMGFWIGTEHQGKGLIVKAAALALNHAFCDLRLTSVWCGYYAGNDRSKRAQEKIGFRPHHMEKNTATPLGDYRDTYYSVLTIDDWVRNQLRQAADPAYKAFNLKLIPGADPDKAIGVRLPIIRKIARRLGADSPWLNHLPHQYLEEDLLHSVLLSGQKDMHTCMDQLNKFLPCIDNWAVCDTISPACFMPGDRAVFAYAKQLVLSDAPYSIRLGYVLLLRLFTKDAFRPRHLELIARTRYDHYYVRMAIAWYLAEAAVEHFDDVYDYLRQFCPDTVIARMAIRKCVESYRISADNKAKLKDLRATLSIN